MTQALLPCRFCGGSPNALTFANEYIQGELRMWVCENNERFGGSCPNGNGYLSPDFWNEAMRAKEQSHSPTGDDVLDRCSEALLKRDYIMGGTFYRREAAKIVLETAATPSPNRVSQSAVERDIAYHCEQARNYISLPADQTPEKHMVSARWHLLMLADLLSRRAALATQPASNTGLREALDDLQQAEAEYRLMHDLHGDGSQAAGRAWDLMRRAGNKARTILETDDGGSKIIAPYGVKADGSPRDVEDCE